LKYDRLAKILFDCGLRTFIFQIKTSSELAGVRNRKKHWRLSIIPSTETDVSRMIATTIKKKQTNKQQQHRQQSKLHASKR